MFLDVSGMCRGGYRVRRKKSFVAACTWAEIVVQRLGIGWCFVEPDFLD